MKEGVLDGKVVLLKWHWLIIFIIQEDEIQNEDAAQIYNLLILQWRNEVYAPELLPYQKILIEQTQNYLNLPQSRNKLVNELVKMQQNRLSYLIKDYHSVRQKKIASQTEVDPELLSDAERLYY